MKRRELDPFWHFYTTKTPAIFANNAEYVVTDHHDIAWVLFYDGTRQRCKRAWTASNCGDRLFENRWMAVNLPQDTLLQYRLRDENSPTSG